MLPDDLFVREIMEDLRGTRSLALKFILPVVLILPFALVNVPDTLKASGLPLIVLFLGVLGSSVGLAKLRESRMSERLATLPVSRRRMILQYLGANVVMDGLQVMVPSVIMVAALWSGAPALPSVLLALLLSLVLANCLGILVAIITGGSGEVHLFSAIAVLVVAAASGLFFQNIPSGMELVASVLPFNYLAESLLTSSGGDLLVLAVGCSAFTGLFVALMIWVSPRFFRM